MGKLQEDLAEVVRLMHEYEKHTRDSSGCSDHPDAPHGFDRNGSHNADRYVCECEGWEPQADENPKIVTDCATFVRNHHAELHRLTDRLEAADALLLDIKEWDVAEASRRFSLSDNGVIFILPDVLRSRIQSHLQGAGDEA